LDVLFAYFQGQLFHAHFFRTAVDNWFMYNRGGPFLKTGKPWFWNKPRSNDKRLPEMHYHSVEASKLMDSREVLKGKLIVEHAVPISQLHKIIRDNKPESPEDIKKTLISLYRLGVVTYEEDKRLRKSAMPFGWSPNTGNPFARYEAAGIVGTARDPQRLR
jgi:hypothetical protein